MLRARAEDFVTGLSKAIFRLHDPDKAELVDRLKAEGMAQEDIDKLPYSYFKER